MADGIRLSILLAAALVGAPAVSAAQQLRLGNVFIQLGGDESVTVAKLRTGFSVQQIEGGWSVRSRVEGDVHTPSVGITTRHGQITGASFIWGPGHTPSAESVSEQLSYALPASAACHVDNVVRRSEGGTVRWMVLRCRKATIRYQTGVWPSGNTASISIELE